MIVKRNFNPLKVLQYVQKELLLCIIVAFGVWFLHQNQWLPFILPFSIVGILGSALAIFIAFRNNTAYSRWWEARSLWSNILQSSRVLARLIITFTDSHAHQPNYEKERSEKFKREMVYRAIAWVHALRIQLRGLDNWQAVQKHLPPSEWQELQKAHNKPAILQLLMGKCIYEAMANGTLGGFDSFQMEGQLLALAAAQSSCERIKNTPLLRQYDYFTRLFLYVFIICLPFTLVPDFAKMQMAYMAIPTTLVVSFVFAIIGKVGEVNENPFENKITDVPLDYVCNTIERDLKEMLGEKDLPAKVSPEHGFLM